MTPAERRRPATRRRIAAEDGRAALAAWRADPGHASPARRTAVRYLLEELGERHPGHSVEVRVPPDGAVQCVEGPRHTRGTPPNVVEMEPETFLALATGEMTWQEAVSSSAVRASGLRADLSGHLPIV